MDVKEIARAALLAQKLDETARMPHHASWLVTELEDASETITALLQVAWRVSEAPHAKVVSAHIDHVRIDPPNGIPLEMLGQTVALVPVPVKEGA